MADKRIEDQEKQLSKSCATSKENLKNKLQAKAAREADEIVEELQKKHQNVLQETE